VASNLQCKHFVILTLISVVGLGFAMAIPWLASAHSVVARHSNASDDLCFVKNNETLDEYSSTDASAVQQAVDAASLGDVLLIAGECAGTQTRGGLIQTVYISKSLTLEGGYAPGDWTVERDLETYTTTLDADQGGRVVVISSTAGVNIDGLYLTGGFADNPSLDGNGGGIWTNSFVTLTNTIVYSNTSDWDGGGMYSLGVSPFLKGVTFSENVGFHGGALYNDCDSGTSSPMLTDVTLSGNSASYGGAMANMCENGNNSARLTNVVMSGNAANTGGGWVVSVCNGEGSAVMTNVSFSGNSAVYYGGAIEAEADGKCLLVVNNSIFWNNRADGVTGTIDANFHSYGVVYGLTHSLVEGAYTGGSWIGGTYFDGGGNIDEEPLFLDPIAPS